MVLPKTVTSLCIEISRKNQRNLRGHLCVVRLGWVREGDFTFILYLSMALSFNSLQITFIFKGKNLKFSSEQET